MNWTGIIITKALFYVFCGVVTAEGRSKRIINGELLVDRENSGYASPKYYVWIGFDRDLLSIENKWDYKRQVCGGTLLTPQIVQSACHCFCDYHPPRKSGEEWAYRNSNKFAAVVGCSEFSEESPCTPVSTGKFSFHPLCRKVFSWISHDYALFTLQQAVSVSGQITTAPVYPTEDMAMMWKRFVTRQSVCMIMGFGKNHPDGERSKELRHGWQAIQHYIDCYEEYSFQSTTTRKFNITEYQGFATWTCMKPFGRELGTGQEDLIAKGDSGSPITCDNIYFGLVSQTSMTFTAYHSNTNDLIYNAYANSKYYRLIMISDMLDQTDGGYRYDEPPVNSVTMQPETAPPNLYAVRSSGQRLDNYFKTSLGFIAISVHYNNIVM